MKTRCTFYLLTLFLVLCSTQANSALITKNYISTFSLVDQGFTNVFTVGDSFEWSISYDDSLALPSLPSTTLALPTYAATFALKNYDISTKISNATFFTNNPPAPNYLGSLPGLILPYDTGNLVIINRPNFILENWMFSDQIGIGGIETFYFVDNEIETIPVIAFTTKATPIPGAIWLLVTGILGIVGYRKKYA